MGGSHGCILEGTGENQSPRTLKGVTMENSLQMKGMRQVNFNVTKSKSSELFPQTINNDRKNE